MYMAIENGGYTLLSNTMIKILLEYDYVMDQTKTGTVYQKKKKKQAPSLVTKLQMKQALE